MQKNKKKIEQLKNLKLLQQQKLRILIVKMEKEKDCKLGEIEILDNKIQDMYKAKSEGYTKFYNSIKNSTYSYDKVLSLNFATEKINFDIEELRIKKNVLFEELQEIENSLLKEKINFKKLVIKEEKYKEFTLLT